MRSKSLLLGSVSVVAVSAATAPAIAQDNTIPDNYSFSVEGGFLMAPNTVAEDKLGSFPSNGIVNIQDNIGYRAAISLGKQIDPLWDLRAGASLNHQLESVSTFEASFRLNGSTVEFLSQLRIDFDFENVDFEVGYTPVLDENLEVRLFAGIRGLHYSDLQAYSAAQDKIGGVYNFEVDSEFYGAGPRLGAGASTRFGDSSFGMSGMLAGSVIHGRQRTTVEGSASINGSTVQVSETEEEWKTVIDVEAALGLDYYVADESKLTLGYRGEQIFNVGDSTFSIGDGGSDRLVHGPFMRYESDF